MTDARKYLESFRITEARIRLKTEQLHRLRASLTSITSSPDGEQVSHTRNVDPMSETIAMIIDMQKEIDQQTAELYEARHALDCLMDRIDPNHAYLLTRHYIEGVSSRKLGKDAFISPRQMQRRLKEAVEEFQIVLNRVEEKKLSQDDVGMS